MTRVGIIGGCRTAFLKVGGAFAESSLLELGTEVVRGALTRTGTSPDSIDELAFSTVLLDPRIPNLARELVLRSDLPKGLNAHFVSNNCISGLVAMNVIREGILSGRISNGIAGGVELMSSPALSLRREAERFFHRLARAKTIGSRLAVASTYRPRFAIPIPPSPKEPSTGLTMGEHCELMAKEFQVSREAQDALALRSHHQAAASREFHAADIVPVRGATTDTIVRGDTSPEKLRSLRPVFDRSSTGTITAGNASALTDGASAVLLMGESEATRRGLKPLAWITGVVFSAVRPDEGLLMAPARAVPALLARHHLNVNDIDLFEVHEAFAAQVICNQLAWERGWSRYPDATAIGAIPPEKLNPSGGSLAIGHPFAATGGRLLLSAARQLAERNKRRAIISVCAAGGMACAVLLERE